MGVSAVHHSFSGHETFPFRYPWLKKGFDAVHPLTALVLGPLFRQLAQNERSLFAFLASSEPFGFQEFLHQQVWAKPSCETYRLDRLYDYWWCPPNVADFSQPQPG
jgi:hypothetical protein